MTDDENEVLYTRAARSLRATRPASDLLARVLSSIDDVQQAEAGSMRAAHTGASSGTLRAQRFIPGFRVAAVAIFALGLALGAAATWGRNREMPESTAPTIVQFTLSAAGAQHVSLVGEFNRWDANATPMIRDAGGSWHTAVRLQPGRHLYAFLVDSNGWVTDPYAPLSPEHWYGARNSVLIVNDGARQ